MKNERDNTADVRLERVVSAHVGPIERDEGYDRTYIPLPGGWEVQTKGKGSTFRICDTKSGDRLAIPPSPYLHETLERMAREIHAAVTLPDPPKDGE